MRLIFRILAIFSFVMMPFIASAEDWKDTKAYKTFAIGDENVKSPKKPEYGILMSGGGDWPYEAFRWFAAKSGNGHIVILRAPDADATTEDMTGTQTEMYNEVKGFASIRTFAFFDRAASYDSKLLEAIKKADGIFLAGGDQSRYVKYWRGTPVEKAIEAHVAAGKPLGGTSAGLAVQGEYLYGAMDGGSITTPEALPDPLGKAVTIETKFLNIPMLKGIITDSHFKERNRQGRLAAFMAKSMKMGSGKIFGLGIDEQTALCVEKDGSAKLFSNKDGAAWLFDFSDAPITQNGKPLDVKNIDVKGIGTDSYFDILTKKVENPKFVRQYEIKNGEMKQKMKWTLAIHGGAGVIEPGDLTPEKEVQYRAGLDAALQAGEKILSAGGSSLDAVEATVKVLENNPLFNAGKGAVFTAQGTNELDAAIMDGKTKKAGAVAGVTRTKNPISLARAVMEKSGRLFLARDGADRFSIENGLEQVDPSYYYTDERWQQLQKWRAKKFSEIDQTHKFGTVGAVAIDVDGNLAAATSTGGLTGKVFGRIGDTPIIGAGTIAINGICAVSATGTGEYFIRENAARQICDRIQWNKQDINSAAYDTIMAVGALGGDGGLIAMDGEGNVAFAINDIGMYRGIVGSNHKRETSIYPDDTIKAAGKTAKTSKEMH